MAQKLFKGLVDVGSGGLWLLSLALNEPLKVAIGDSTEYPFVYRGWDREGLSFRGLRLRETGTEPLQGAVRSDDTIEMSSYID